MTILCIWRPGSLNADGLHQYLIQVIKLTAIFARIVWWFSLLSWNEHIILLENSNEVFSNLLVEMFITKTTSKYGKYGHWIKQLSVYKMYIMCGVVWCGVAWRGVVWCGVVWCGVVWCGVVWCGVVWCGVSFIWKAFSKHYNSIGTYTFQNVLQIELISSESSSQLVPESILPVSLAMDTLSSLQDGLPSTPSFPWESSPLLIWLQARIEGWSYNLGDFWIVGCDL